MVKFHPLSDEDRELIHGITGRAYLHGSCYAFAAAMQRLTGWTMIALHHDHPATHAGVRDPAGNLYDVRGKVPYAKFGRPFDALPPYTLREVTLEELRTIRPITEHEIIRAMQLIEVIFPDVPTRKTVLRANIEAFMQDLEELSRRHGVWIRSSVPTMKPHLAEGEGAGAGYDVFQSPGIGGYMIDRHFRTEE